MDQSSARPPPTPMPQDAPRPLVQLRGVSKRYGKAEVLSAIDLTVLDGEFLTILGPSGSGKTTILRLIGGFTEPSAGSVLFDGADLRGVPIFRRPFNTVFQDYALFPHMTVAENVGYGLLVRGVRRAELRQQVAEVLQTVALDAFAGRYPAQLSGGQKQRVALARAIVCQPRVILLDEPLAALDAELRRQMQLFLKQLQRQIATTFLFVTHDQEEAITMSDRIVVMNHGRIEQVGLPRAVYYHPHSEFVAGFFGDNNLLDGRIVGSPRPGAAGTIVVETALGAIVCRAAAAPTVRIGTVKVAVRPEAIRVATTPIGLDNEVAATVAEVRFVGPISHLVLRPRTAPTTTLLVKIASEREPPRLAPGQLAVVGWAADDCAVIVPAETPS